VFSVNAIAFQNQFQTFATCGSDGVVTFWDKGESVSQSNHVFYFILFGWLDGGWRSCLFSLTQSLTLLLPFSLFTVDHKQRLKAFPAIQRTIPCAAFNAQGNLFAYASSYDWSQGSVVHAPGTPNEIYVHYTPEEEIKPKSKKR
jgi:mRNA export factor